MFRAVKGSSGAFLTEKGSMDGGMMTALSRSQSGAYTRRVNTTARASSR